MHIKEDRMRIGILSNYSGFPDEGVKNTAFYLYEELSKRHNVFHVNTRKSMFSKNFWRQVRDFQPQIIHFFLRPTIITLAMAKILKFYLPSAKIVMSALQPPLHYRLLKRAYSLERPDLMLIQSEETERIFSWLGYKTTFLPGGVDTNRFVPVSANFKSRLRRKYQLSEKEFVILHVGNMNRERNLLILGKIREQQNIQVIIVTSTSFRPATKVYKALEKSGCRIWQGYFENLEEIYCLADCYVFPTRKDSNSACIELPLSIMEAMACNLAVISTKFGAVPRVFEARDGFIFAEEEEDFLSGISQIKNGDLEIKTREKIMPYSWVSVTKRLEKIYSEIITQEHLK
jgi:glycosyltransferase involved in cell wall biosynthesis